MRINLISSLPSLLPLAVACCSAWSAPVQPPEARPTDRAHGATHLPYVYTEWEQFTTGDGLPDDHIFAVTCDGPRVWIGTENGLACYNKDTGKIKSWTEKDGLPWRVVSSIDVSPKTGEVWVGFFGGGLARFSAGRFDHFHQMNSGLVNDVVYGVVIENDNVWCATTAGASRYNTVKDKWDIFTEKNAPMEEIWNYGCDYADGKVYLGVWGSGVLEFDVATQGWKDYLDPDGEMEIDLYRDDGIVHVITTGVSYIDKILWVSSYFGACRYDGRHWRGYFAHDCGVPSDFQNAVKGRSAHEAWFCTDKGLGVLADFETDTWVTYTSDHKTRSGKAVIQQGHTVLATVPTGLNLPHNYVLGVDFDGHDVWVATSKGLARARGQGYYPRLTAPDPTRLSGDASREVAAPPGPGADSLDTAAILDRLNVGPYEVPDLPLKTNANYAFSPMDVEPFRHVKPFKEHFLLQLEYTGPGRAIPEPEQVDTVKIGFLGPIEPTVSVATGGKSHEEILGKAMLSGCRLAIEQANKAGGYHKRKIPFELIVRNDNGLWGASGNEIIRMAYEDKVWAILGTIDGANTHIAIRVALKAELPMLTSGDTDPTFVETNIPWVFRSIGDDRQQNYFMLDYLYRKLKLERVAIIRSSNRYGRFGVREIRDGSRRLGHPIVAEMAYKVGDRDFSVQLDRIEAAKPQAVVHWGDAEEAARFLNQMRARGMTQPYLCSDRSVSEAFVRIAGKNAEGVICGYPWNPARDDPKLETFRGDFQERFGTAPDTYAVHAYDGMNMFIWAIQNAGLNRAKIRDVLACRSEPWPGVSGDIPLSAALDDAGEVYLARREGDRWNYYSRDDLGVPRGRIIDRERVKRTTALTPSP